MWCGVGGDEWMMLLVVRVITWLGSGFFVYIVGLLGLIGLV